MRAAIDTLCLWIGRFVLASLVLWLVWRGIDAIYCMGVANGRAQTSGYQPAVQAPQAAASASQPVPQPARPAHAAAPASQPVPQQPEAPLPPTRRLTIEVSPDGQCRIGIDVPADAAMRQRYIKQRRQLGLGPC